MFTTSSRIVQRENSSRSSAHRSCPRLLCWICSQRACADMWILAAQRFREKPYSNGKDARYEAVKAELRAQFGAHAIHNGNKARLKQIAIRCGADIASDIAAFSTSDEFPRLQALQIFDCRPKISAQGNAVMGRGTESATSYVGRDIFHIPQIQRVSQSSSKIILIISLKY